MRSSRHMRKTFIELNVRFNIYTVYMSLLKGFVFVYCQNSVCIAKNFKDANRTIQIKHDPPQTSSVIMLY